MSSLTPSDYISNWLEQLNAALKASDAHKASELFGEECYWRDMLGFTWNIYTAEGKSQIKEMIQNSVLKLQPFNWQRVGEAEQKGDYIEGWVRFETKISRGVGIIRLKEGKAWTFYTAMEELKGHEIHQGLTRDFGTEHKAHPGKKTWLELRNQTSEELGITKNPYVVIIGGGHCGISLAARLKLLGVPTLILDRYEKPGDSWRRRYKYLCLHDPVWYDHMPHIPFPEHWPIFSPKDKIANWIEHYLNLMELNFWGNADCKRAQFDEARQEWVLEVLRENQTLTVRTKHIVFATGLVGHPYTPKIKGIENFKGKIVHSHNYDAPENYKGKKCVVVGCSTSAHDICEGLWEQGADVTMFQRSSTSVFRSDTIRKYRWGPLYSEEAIQKGIDADKADHIVASYPYKIATELGKIQTQEMREHDAKFHKDLTKAGFKLDFGEDGSGISIKIMRGQLSFYFDVGGSDLIINGQVKLKSGGNIEKLTEKAICFDDGSQIEVDLIVFATGYHSFEYALEEVCGREVVEKVGKCWGMGSNTRNDPGPWEGEVRNLWKPTHQEGLWIHGGNFQMSRFYSKLIALSIKARMEGIETSVYGMPPALHP